MELDLKKYLEATKIAALTAGKYLSENFGKKHKAKFKSANDIGLAEDIESEKIILSIIQEKYPDHNYYSEEFGEINNKSKFTWFIDPLDGTNNYFAGIPYFSVSIALLFENEIIVGVVYNPISKQLFEATKDGGAFLNGVPISPSSNSDLQQSVCSFIQGHDLKDSPELISIKSKVSNNFRRVISTWAPALDWALLYFGGIDVLISYESELEDMFAGLLIAKESGVKITNFSGKDFKIGDKKIFASNNMLHKSTLKMLTS
jgi:myo-inositol-1(or 4)-monophosphatase